MDKPNIWIRLLSNTSIYIVITSKTTGLNSYLLQSFAYNNAPSTTNDVSPFFTNKRYYPNITIHSECNIASSQACDFAVDLDKLQNILKAEISVT